MKFGITAIPRNGMIKACSKTKKHVFHKAQGQDGGIDQTQGRRGGHPLPDLRERVARQRGICLTLPIPIWNNQKVVFVNFTL